MGTLLLSGSRVFKGLQQPVVTGSVGLIDAVHLPDKGAVPFIIAV